MAIIFFVLNFISFLEFSSLNSIFKLIYCIFVRIFSSLLKEGGDCFDIIKVLFLYQNSHNFGSGHSYKVNRINVLRCLAAHFDLNVSCGISIGFKIPPSISSKLFVNTGLEML